MSNEPTHPSPLLRFTSVSSGPWWQTFFSVSLIVAVGLAVLQWHQCVPLRHSNRDAPLPFMVARDSECYRAIAENHSAEVESPFSKRVLYPLLAKYLAQATGVAIPTAFMFLNVISLAMLAYCLAEALRLLIGQPLLAVPLLLTPFPLESLELGYLPDLFHMAVIALFFLLLLHGRERWSLVVLFVAFLARENTLVLCVAGAALAWLRHKKVFLIGSLSVLIGGIAAGSMFTKIGKPNIHHLPDFVYLAGKVPYYFLLNLMGIRVWSNVRPIGDPLFRWTLPHFLRFGLDETIGITVQWAYPVATIIILLTVFGSGPLLVFKLFKREGRRFLSDAPFAVHLAFVYGLVSYFLGVFVGDWTDRLVGFAWPLFWIALPYFFVSYEGRLSRSRMALLIACYVLICWWPRLFGWGSDRDVLPPWECLGILVPYMATIFGYRFQNMGNTIASTHR